MNNNIKNILNKVGIHFEYMNELDGMIIQRDLLLSHDVYISLYTDINELKKIYSSSSLNSLHKNAKSNQKWPLLNLVRQLLKTYEYELLPIRKSNGYEKQNGTLKKKYKRFFMIQKV